MLYIYVIYMCVCVCLCVCVCTNDTSVPVAIKTRHSLTISKERMQTIQKTKVNTESMCPNLEEEMGLLTICCLHNLSVKIDVPSILREFC